MDWQEKLKQGRAGESLALYLNDAEANAEIKEALSTLLGIQTALRDKAWERARKLADELLDVGLVDVTALRDDLEQLKSAAAKLEKREIEAALEQLTSIQTPLLFGEAETLRGTAAIFQAETDKAKAAFDKALEHDPKHYRAMTNLGNLELEAGNVDAAIEAYEQALRINDGFANAHHNLGVAYRRKGQVAKSVRHLRKAQSASQRQMRDEARSALSKGAKGQGFKLLRWVFYGGLAVIVYLILRNRGII
jgi:tetratricopeptide (TPR) repeat protein